jgi:hypothetical protein
MALKTRAKQNLLRKNARQSSDKKMTDLNPYPLDACVILVAACSLCR